MVGSLIDQRRLRYASELGLTDQAAAGMSIADLESAFFANPSNRSEGTILSEVAAGELVKVPFGTGVVASSGGLAHTIGGGSASTQAALISNPDGSGGGVNFSVPAGLGQGASWTEQLYGSRIGIRWRRNNASTLLPFGMVVDGVAYTIKNTRYHSDSVLTTAGDHETLYTVVSGLDPSIPHTTKLIVISDPYGAVVKSLLAYGWLLEKAAGYKETPRWGSIVIPVLLAAGATALSTTTVYRRIKFHNTDGAAQTVTFKNGATNIQVVPMAAGASGEIDFGGPTVLTAAYTLTPSLANVITWAPVLAEVR